MTEESGRRKRLLPITAAAAVFAVLVLVFTSMAFAPVAGAGAVRGNTPAQLSPSVVLPSALANTLIDLNRSQSAGNYVKEYVTLNNSTTLTALPAALTVVAATCKWVIVANLSEAASPASVFHNVQFHNVTSGNNTGNLADKASGFRVCGGTGLWINYVQWTYSIYQFSTTSLGTNGTAAVTFGDYPGTTTGPAKVSAPFGTSYALALTVSANLTFSVTLPEQTNSTTSCSQLGQVCSFTRYTFSAATDTTNTSSANVIAFTVASKLLVTGAYENWSVTYTSASVNANSAVGGIFTAAGSFFQTYIVQFWYLWILGLLAVALVAAIGASRRGRRHQRR